MIPHPSPNIQLNPYPPSNSKYVTISIIEIAIANGIRVQNSVFECNVNPAQWVALKSELLGIYENDMDSLRFYFLGSGYKSKIEHYGAKPAVDVEDPLVL